METAEVQNNQQQAVDPQAQADALFMQGMGAFDGQGANGGSGMFGGQPQAQPAQGEPPADGGAKAKEEAAPAEPQEEPPQEEAAPATGGENPLVAFYGGGAEQAAQQVKVPKSVSEWFEKQGYGDVPTVLAERTKYKGDLDALATKYNEAEKRVSMLDKLSVEARNVLEMDLEGKDWKQVLQRPSLDFTVEPDKADAKQLVDTYAKGKVSEDDWAEFNDKDGDPVVKDKVEAIIDKAKMLYAKDRDEAVNYTKRQQEAYQKKEAAYKESYNKSLEHVYNTVPGSKAYQKQIEEAFATLNDHFFEKDGVTVKPTALLDAWRLKNLDVLLASKIQKVKQEASDEAQIDLARRTPQKQAVQSASKGQGESPQELADRLFREGLQPFGGAQRPW